MYADTLRALSRSISQNFSVIDGGEGNTTVKRMEGVASDVNAKAFDVKN